MRAALELTRILCQLCAFQVRSGRRRNLPPRPRPCRAGRFGTGGLRRPCRCRSRRRFKSRRRSARVALDNKASQTPLLMSHWWFFIQNTVRDVRMTLTSTPRRKRRRHKHSLLGNPPGSRGRWGGSGRSLQNPLAPWAPFYLPQTCPKLCGTF